MTALFLPAHAADTVADAQRDTARTLETVHVVAPSAR
jgi:hypothetical protein